MVGIAPKIVFLSQNFVGIIAPLSVFPHMAFSQKIYFEKLHQFLNIGKSNHSFNICRRDLQFDT